MGRPSSFTKKSEREILELQHKCIKLYYMYYSIRQVARETKLRHEQVRQLINNYKGSEFAQKMLKKIKNLEVRK